MNQKPCYIMQTKLFIMHDKIVKFTAHPFIFKDKVHVDRGLVVSLLLAADMNGIKNLADVPFLGLQQTG